MMRGSSTTDAANHIIAGMVFLRLLSCGPGGRELSGAFLLFGYRRPVVRVLVIRAFVLERVVRNDPVPPM